MVVVPTDMDGHDVAGGAVPVGKGGKVELDGPPVLSEMDPEGVGKGPYGRVWITGGRLVMLILSVLSVPERAPLVLLMVFEDVEAFDDGTEALGAVERGGYGIGPVPVGKLRVWTIGGTYGTGPVPVGIGVDELTEGTTPLLGAVESGG